MQDSVLLFWGEALESFVSCGNISTFYYGTDTVQFAGRRG